MLTIADKSKTRYNIVIKEKHSKSELTAAKDLQKYIEKISGAIIEIVTDDNKETEKEIVIGITNRDTGIGRDEIESLGQEGFILKTEGEKLFIIGSDIRGALYGVYTFLETYCGCRFYTYFSEKIPQTSVLTIPEIFDKQIPVFEYRNSYWKSVSEEAICAKLKLNDRKHCGISQTYGGSRSYTGGFEHTIGYLSGSCGKDDRVWDGQPCFSSRDVFDTVLKNVRVLLEENPQAEMISITQNDGIEGWCTCDACKAAFEEDGSQMGPVLRFVNKIADTLKDDYPNLKIDTFAYRATRKPPKKTVPRDNVIIRLCSIECCFRHPLNECKISPAHDVKDSFYDNVLEWTKLCKNLYIWNYTTDFTNFSIPYANFDTLLENERFFADNNVKGVFEQGNIASLNGEFGELRGYLLAKTLWNPYMTKEEFRAHMEDFMNGFYGKGGKYLSEYLAMELECSKDSHFGIYHDDPTLYIYMPGYENKLEAAAEYLRRSEILWDKAEEAAENEEELSNIRRSRIQIFNYKNFVLHHYLDIATAEEKSGLLEKIVENNKLHHEYMKKYNVTHNQEFNSIEGLQDPDYTSYPLLWKLKS